MSTQRKHSVFQRMARFFYVLHPLCIRKCSGTGPLHVAMYTHVLFDDSAMVLNSTLPVTNFRNVTKFNAQVFVKCLNTNYFIHPIDIIQTAYISCCQVGQTLWLALPSNTRYMQFAF